MKHPCNPGWGRADNRGEALEQTAFESHPDPAIHWGSRLVCISTLESEHLDLSLFYWVPASY